MQLYSSMSEPSHLPVFCSSSCQERVLRCPSSATHSQPHLPYLHIPTRPDKTPIPTPSLPSSSLLNSAPPSAANCHASHPSPHRSSPSTSPDSGSRRRWARRRARCSPRAGGTRAAGRRFCSPGSPPQARISIIVRSFAPLGRGIGGGGGGCGRTSFRWCRHS